MQVVEVRPLVNLSPAPENDFRLRGLPGHAPIQGPDGAFYGHEWARWRHDTLDVRVDEILRTSPAGARVLDLGCATGSRAAAFSREGCHVTGVDILDQSRSVAQRAAELKHDAGVVPLGSLAFVQADLRTWPTTDDERWDLIHARRVISFMTCDDVAKLFARLRHCLGPGGVLVVSFIASGLDDPRAMVSPGPQRGSVRISPGFYSHDVRAVTAALEAGGFAVAEAFSDGLCDAGCIARPI